MRVFTVLAAPFLLVSCSLLVACGNESDAGEEPSMTPSSSGVSESDSPPPSGPAEQAKADLVKRLGVDAAQVSVVSSAEVMWRDGSLGCPEPGMHYTQALVNGSRVVLESGGKEYHYHSGPGRPPFLCTNPQPPVGG
ncbi:hypothetical protein E0H75_19635 [Kribbella capetownensis]|uniref:Lipoprotein n=1 Tax=Kribbella capetownensis TaxID=1572659 RepID=A0A4R0JUD3_9ACTN|nr:hypothetical protein [Kribbella capetownensis]TCC48786.1 hypothetical protein E0H75_19635 [Kribbella capetownensis]